MVLGNVVSWQKSFQTYPKLDPAPHNALQEFYDETNSGHDRSWQLYGFVEKHFQDWVIVSFSPEPARASQMYDFDFGEIRNVKIANYDPQLTSAEAEYLKTLQHLIVNVSRSVPGTEKRVTIEYMTAIPRPDSPDRLAVVLIRENVRFIVPISMAPKRFKKLS